MELVRIKHYGKSSSDDIPYFVLSMIDGLDYISHDMCHFVEDSEDNRRRLNVALCAPRSTLHTFKIKF